MVCLHAGVAACLNLRLCHTHFPSPGLCRRRITLARQFEGLLTMVEWTELEAFLYWLILVHLNISTHTALNTPGCWRTRSCAGGSFGCEWVSERVVSEWASEWQDVVERGPTLDRCWQPRNFDDELFCVRPSTNPRLTVTSHPFSFFKYTFNSIWSLFRHFQRTYHDVSCGERSTNRQAYAIVMQHYLLGDLLPRETTILTYTH